MIELIGYLGGILMALCGLPAAIEAYRNKTCIQNWLFLFMWLFGEVLLVIYVLLKYVDIPLLLNYSINIAVVSILIKYNRR